MPEIYTIFSRSEYFNIQPQGVAGVIICENLNANMYQMVRWMVCMRQE